VAAWFTALLASSLDIPSLLSFSLSSLGQAFFTLAFVCHTMASKEKQQAQLRIDLSNWVQRALFSLEPHEVEYLLQMSAQDCREMDDFGDEVTVQGIDEDLHDCQ
jgi:hypothetical protein